jgi:putative flippase GtrA
MRWAAAASSSKNNFPALEWAMWVVRIQPTHPNKKGADLCAFIIVVLFDYIVNDYLSLF